MAEDHEERIKVLEQQVAALTEAVHTLARGMESPPVRDEPFEEAAAQAARRAHELLLTVRR